MTVDLVVLRELLSNVRASRPDPNENRVTLKPKEEDRALRDFVQALPDVERRQLNAAARALRFEDDVRIQINFVQSDDLYVTTLETEELDAALARIEAEGLELGAEWPIVGAEAAEATPEAPAEL